MGPYATSLNIPVHVLQKIFTLDLMFVVVKKNRQLIKIIVIVITPHHISSSESML